MPLAYFHVLDVDASRPDNTLPSVPGFPDNTLPTPPPGVWPPPTVAHPIVPVPPASPDNTLPGGGAKPDNTLPAQPGTIWPPVGGGANGKYWVVVGIPGIGWRYVCIDISLGVDNTLPGSQPHPDQGLPVPPVRPDQGLPPSAQPKR